MVLKSSALRRHKIQLSNMTVYVYGDAAVVTGAAAQHGDFQGQPLAGKIAFTDTFVRDGDFWKAVASQRRALSNPVPEVSLGMTAPRGRVRTTLPDS